MQINGIDFKNLWNERFLRSEFVSGISKHLGDYEKKVKSVVHEIDLKSRDAREKSKKQLDVFADQVKKTRVDLEKRVVSAVNKEAERLNKGLNELVGYLKTLSAAEQKKASAPRKSGKAGAKAKSGGKKKASGPKKASAKKVLAARKSAETSSSPLN